MYAIVVKLSKQDKTITLVNSKFKPYGGFLHVMCVYNGENPKTLDSGGAGVLTCSSHS
jgi:hypothetical protein